MNLQQAFGRERFDGSDGGDEKFLITGLRAQRLLLSEAFVDEF